jgi:hypothetical protein
MTNRMVAVVVAVAVAGAGLFLLLWEARQAHHSPEIPVTAGVLGNGSDRDDVAAQSPDKPADSTVVRPQVNSSPRARYVRSRDLFALVQDLRAAAESGDAQAQTIIADAYYECLQATLPEASRYAGVPTAEHANPQLKPYIDNLIVLDRARCGRFDKQDIVGLQNVLAMYANAAKNGSAEALAIKLAYNANLDDMSDAELAADIQQIKSSGDPNAIGALAKLMGSRAEDREAVFGTPSGSALAQYAWQLAACQMGMDCGPGSPIVRGYCLNGGVCEATSVDRIIALYILSPIDYRTALGMSHQIVSSLHGSH